jgi:hypothetical protein
MKIKSLIITILLISGCGYYHQLDEIDETITNSIMCMAQTNPVAYKAIGLEDRPIALFYGHVDGKEDSKDCIEFITNHPGYKCQMIDRYDSSTSRFDHMCR